MNNKYNDFDPNIYKCINIDLKHLSDNEAYKHFLNFGIKEGRKYKIVIPSDFALSKLGKIILIISYILEGPVIFILLIVTNIIAVICYKKFNQKKELIERANNIEMLAEGEIKKKSKIEKKDRNLLMMTSYMSLLSIVTIFLQFTIQFSYITQSTSLNQKNLGWLLFASIFSIALKQFTSIIIYFNYKTFRNKFKSLIRKFCHS